MKTVQPTATDIYTPNEHVKNLVELVDFSRLNPDEIVWYAPLNDWERGFVPTILAYQQAIDRFQPTKRQLEKIVTIVEKITMTYENELNQGTRL